MPPVKLRMQHLLLLVKLDGSRGCRQGCLWGLPQQRCLWVRRCAHKLWLHVSDQVKHSDVYRLVWQVALQTAWLTANMAPLMSGDHHIVRAVGCMKLDGTDRPGQPGCEDMHELAK